MQCDGKTITFAATLWVQHGGVQVESRGDQVAVTLRDDDAFLKIYNHFGRVLKLFVAEQGAWVDTDTGQAPGAVDLSQAGYVTPAPPQPAGRSVSGSAPTSAKSSAGTKARRSKSKSAATVTGTDRATQTNPAKAHRGAAKQSSAKPSGPAARSSSAKTGATKPGKDGGRKPGKDGGKKPPS